MALELNSGTWKLAFTVGLGQKPRLKTVTARSTLGLLLEIKAAKKRFGLPEDAPVLSCYEAGRDGFWLHRFLLAHGVQNQVVDSSSIEVNRRQEGPNRIVSMQLNSWRCSFVGTTVSGEGWKLVRVPSVADEDQRQLHRELIGLKAERTAVSNSIKGLLATLGLVVVVDETLPKQLEHLRQWDGARLPPGLHQRLLREFGRWQLLNRQIDDLERERSAKIRDDKTHQIQKVRRLMNLKGIGQNGAWLLVYEFFAWRTFKNQRELGSLAGLTPTPYNSGESR